MAFDRGLQQKRYTYVSKVGLIQFRVQSRSISNPRSDVCSSIIFILEVQQLVGKLSVFPVASC